MKRRSAGRWLLGGAAAAALAAGAAWRLSSDALGPPARQGPTQDPPATPEAAGPATTDPASATQVADIWRLRLEKPEGGELALASLRGQPLLMNFWGSWCPPCVAEMPELDQFARESAAAGWRVLGLAVDNPKAVRAFLAQHPVGYTIALAGFEGAGLSRLLGNTQGGLPFTVAFNRQGEVFRQKAGQVRLAELRQWAQAL